MKCNGVDDLVAEKKIIIVRQNVCFEKVAYIYLTKAELKLSLKHNNEKVKL